MATSQYPFSEPNRKGLLRVIVPQKVAKREPGRRAENRTKLGFVRTLFPDYLF